ncbi:MAG: DUF5778 family protein [Halodesulfurarchaeum sp.]
MVDNELGHMSDPGDAELYESARSLLEPGERTLEGLVVHTALPGVQETEMNRAMRELGDVIAGELTDEEVVIDAGEDDDRFGVGQFQGVTLGDGTFVWECQQLLREGTFDLVFYWEATGSLDTIVDGVADRGFDVVPITEDGFGELVGPRTS